MMMRKSIRLDHRLYTDPHAIIAVTMVVADRRDVFRDAAIADAAQRALVSHLQYHHVSAHAWTIMPDHVHLCCSPTAARTLMEIVGGVKQRMMRVMWSRGIHGTLWQRSFYDRFVRQHEDVEAVCRYIWNNPVRAGLVGYWKEWPFNGSTVYDLARFS